MYGVANNDTDLGWWLRQFLGTQEVDLSVEDRMRYSVGRGMMVFGTGESLNQLAREVNGVKILAQNFVMSLGRKPPCSTSLPSSSIFAQDLLELWWRHQAWLVTW